MFVWVDFYQWMYHLLVKCHRNFQTKNTNILVVNQKHFVNNINDVFSQLDFWDVKLHQLLSYKIYCVDNEVLKQSRIVLVTI